MKPIELGRKYAARWYMVLNRTTLANAYAQGYRRGLKDARRKRARMRH